MKHILYICIGLLTLLACRRDNTDDALTKDNKVVAERLFDAYNKHNWDSVASFYADTCAFMTGDSKNVFFHKSKATLIGEWMTAEQNTPDIHAQVNNVYNDRNKTIVEYSLKGQNASGITLQHYCLVWTLKNRKIIRELQYILKEK